jgi:beta-lactamase superfamily II metal-dependent hydrolase
MGYEIDFFPVGEGEKCGDAITLRFGNLFGRRDEQAVVVVDGGFKESGEKIVEHIKNFYKTDVVNLVVSTHPDSDHASGLEVVLDELSVNCLWMHQPWNHIDDMANLFKDGRVTDDSVGEALKKSLDAARDLERLAEKRGIPIVEPFSSVSDDTGCVHVVGPSESFYESLLPDFRGTPQPKESSIIAKVVTGTREFVQKIAENWGLETLDDTGETTAENNTSTIIVISLDGKFLFFTGDAGIPALTDMADRLDTAGFDYSNIDFFQVPHHGSKRNVGPTILDRIIGPKQSEDKKLYTSFLSASKNGAPKHPSKKVTNAFRRRGAYVYVTNDNTILHRHNAPYRGWPTINPLDFYYEFEE